jgi:hypothetical protein
MAKKMEYNNFPPPLLFLFDPGSGMEKNQDPGFSDYKYVRYRDILTTDLINLPQDYQGNYK